MRKFIEKAKYDGKRVEIECRIETERGTDNLVLSTADHPHPDFIDALNDLKEVVGKIWGVPDEWLEGMEMRSATFTENEQQGFGGTITAIKRAENIKGVLVLNTPHHYVGTEAMEGQPSVFTEAQAIALRKYQIEAEAFVNGKRAQGELFDPAMAAAGEKQEVDASEEGNNVVEFRRGKNIAQAPKKEKAKKARVVKRRGVKGLRDAEQPADEAVNS